jgi:hypothetical protein
MYVDGTKISVSLATVEFAKTGKGTRLTVTEQGAFLDGYDDAGSRERGTSERLARQSWPVAPGLTPAQRGYSLRFTVCFVAMAADGRASASHLLILY